MKLSELLKHIEVLEAAADPELEITPILFRYSLGCSNAAKCEHAHSGTYHYFINIFHDLSII